MKIISQTSDQLVLKEGAGIFIFTGLFFCGVGVVFSIDALFIGSDLIWFGIPCTLIGGALGFLTASITVTFDKSAGKFCYKKKRIIGGSEDTYLLSDILRVEIMRHQQIEKFASKNGYSRTSQIKMSQTFLVMKNDLLLPLNFGKGVSEGFGEIIGREKDEAMAAQVAGFLGVPFSPSASPESDLVTGE